MIKVIHLLFLLLICYPVFAQNTNTSLNGKTFQKVRIVLNDSSNLDAQYLTFQNDTLVYYNNLLSNKQTLGLGQISEIKIYNGNYSNTGIWVGGICGTVIGVVVALGTKEDKTTSSRYIETTETTIQTWPIYVFAAAGTLLGYLIGNTIQDWDTVYRKNSSSLTHINLGIFKNQYGLNLAVKIGL